MIKSDPAASIYKHDNEFDHTKRKNYRGSDGKVAKGPPNILVNGPKSGVGMRTVGHLLNKLPPHMKDEYERERELRKQEKAEHDKKL